MSDRKASYPTAPIAWMNQAYEATPTNSTASSPVNSNSKATLASPPSQTMNPSSTITSLER
jgi:hypothetical protein